MAATPYPTDYVYAGNAVALTLKTAVSDGGGDLTLTVNEETAAKGWPSLGTGQRFVIVVGRGTAYETKYAVKTITSSASGSTLVVDSADKTFDNTPVTAAPAGTVVEHCWSATEASTANDHMRTKSAHGSDGELVDQNSAQLLSNKTVMTPTAAGHPTSKLYVDTADALALPKAGGTMTGAIAMGGTNKITGLAAASANGDAVRYEQVTPVYAIGTRTSGSQTITVSNSAVLTYTEDTDPQSLLNTSTGVFTVPSAGLWLATGYAVGSFVDANSYLSIIHGASTTVVASAFPAASGTGIATISTMIYAAASDQIKLLAYNGGGSGTVTVARFAVAKIGL